MGTRLLEAAIALAALASALVLAAMLAAPLLPAPTAATPPATGAATATASTDAPDRVEPPIGLYLLRGPFSFGPCLAIELTAESFPVAEGAEGAATIRTWQRGMTGCDARSTEIETTDASVARVLSDGADAELVGYAVRFRLPLEAGGVETAVEISILAAQSTPELLQALETSTPGSQGLVLDRVPSVDPTFNPLPSAPPVAAVPPSGLFLLQGPLEADGPCLVIELGEPSYPADPTTEGSARVRSWLPAVADPDDPGQCLYRRGEILEAEASVAAGLDPSGNVVAYDIAFSLPGDGSDVPRELELSFDTAQTSPDRLVATIVEPNVGIRVFDRVDAIDPPLGPPPSPSPAP